MNSVVFGEGVSGPIVEIDDAVLALIEWLKARIRLKGCKVSEAWTEEQDAVAAEVSHAPSATAPARTAAVPLL